MSSSDRSTSSPLSLGFVGLGNMGSQMATNLAGYSARNSLPAVRIWNRTRSKVEHLTTSAHCTFAASLEELVQQCDVVHTCLANDEVALAVYRQFFSTPNAAGTIFADHSTLFHTTASTLQQEAKRAGMKYLSCPVFGPPAAAKSAQLLLVISGDEKARDVLRRYVVPTIGKGILDAGEDASKGALMKLLGNNCILGTIELLSESFALAEKTNFDTGLFYEFIRKLLPCFASFHCQGAQPDMSNVAEQWFPAAAWINYGKKIRDGTFSGATGFRLDGGMKDAAFIRRLGAESSTPTPIIDQAWNHLTTAKALGGPGLDWSACSAGMRATAGLKPFKCENFSLQKEEEGKGATQAKKAAKGDHMTNGVNGHAEVQP